MVPLFRQLRAGALLLASYAVVACGGSDAGTGPDAANLGEGELRLSATSATTGSATVGTDVALRPSVRLERAGEPLAGATVVFDVVAGGGSVAGAVQTTDANGVATVGRWTLGLTPGQNVLRARSSGAGELQFSVNGTAPVAGGQPAASAYDVDLRFVGQTPNSAVQSAFAGAVARWREVIVGDLPGVNTGTSAGRGSCGEANFPDTRNTAIDDILIYAEVTPIDGPGKVLGQAKPCYTTQGKTVIGYMKFDSADLATMVNNGTIGDVILHEMGHVIGIGTLWCGLMSRACPTTASDTSWIRTTDVRFTGAAGNAAYQALGAPGSAPIENCASGVPTSCGEGTWYGHWREGTFRNELMTGYISSTGNPLSRLTTGALQDMGYSVNHDAANAYMLPSTASFSGPAPRVEKLEEEPYTGPIYDLDRTGRILRRLQ